MLKEMLSFEQYKKMIDDSVDFKYLLNDEVLYNLDKNCMILMNMDKKIKSNATKIDDKQIEWLDSKRNLVKKSDLPCGVAYYHDIPVAVMYPFRNVNYKSFNNLYNEDDSLVFNNLKRSYYCNKELLNRGIYNIGFNFNNIVYDNKNVKLINLDSFNIKSGANYKEVYSNYLYNLKQLFLTKLLVNYERDEAIEIYHQYNSMFNDYNEYMSIDYPLEVIKEMQRKLILK